MDTPPSPSPTYFDPPPPPALSPTFFDLPPPPALSPTFFDLPPPPTPSPAVSNGLIVGSVIAGVVALAVVVGIIIYVCVYKKKDKKEQRPDLKPFSFSYEELATATHGFSKFNCIGEGGFGKVYRGTHSKGEIAVKRLKAKGDNGKKEFEAEVEVISRVHHKHLVSLVGYCITSSHRMLVYDYVSNNSLESHLHGQDGNTINWSTRLKIAIGSAKGLAYLHEDCHPKIIHRDIKAANILLDSNFEAKVADFGLAKLIPEMKSYVIPSAITGSLGYIAPEYLNTAKVSYRSDVYSYGVLLLELITGLQAWSTSEYGALVSWAKPMLEVAKQKRDYSAWVDQRLKMDYDQSEMDRMITCAAACINLSPKRRPHMSQIVRALGGDDSAINQIAVLACTDDVTGSSDESSSYATAQRTEDHWKMIRSSQG